MARRNAHRSKRVGAERERGEPGRDRSRRAARRAARGVAEPRADFARDPLCRFAWSCRARLRRAASCRGSPRPRHAGARLRRRPSSATRRRPGKPARVAMPATSRLSLIATGRPSSRPIDAAFAAPRGARRRGGERAVVEVDVGVEARILALDRGAIARGQARRCRCGRRQASTGAGTPWRRAARRRRRRLLFSPPCRAFPRTERGL